MGFAALAVPHLGRLAGGAVDLVRVAPAGAAERPWTVPAMVTRAQWGAEEWRRKDGQEYDPVVEKIIIHHTASPNSSTNYPAICRGIMAMETAGEYIDIAYNWLIDPLGNLYEGRWAQDYPTGAPHTGEKDRENVRGGHALYHNSRTIGVALIGDYSAASPSNAMIDTLVGFLAWKCARWGLDPLGRSSYSAADGSDRDLYNISGHRDTGSTACPGSTTYAMLPTIRQRVRDVLGSAPPPPGESAAAAIAARGGPIPVAIRSNANGMYVAAEFGTPDGLKGMLRSRADTVGDWEGFVLEPLGADLWAIKSSSGQYVAAERGYSEPWTGVLRARSAAIGAWEKFRIAPVPGSADAFTVRSADTGRYASAELNYSGLGKGALRARAASPLAWESFAFDLRLPPLPPPGTSAASPIADRRPTIPVALRANANDLYISAELGWSGTSYAAARARAASIGAWERFVLEAVAGDLWVIKSEANGRYVSAELGYQGSWQGALRARAGSPGAWEKFRIEPVAGSDTLFTLRSAANELYVASEKDWQGTGAGMLRARSSAAAGWEQFAVVVR